MLSALARDLACAERDRTPIAPLTATTPELTVEDAYQIQKLNIERRLAAGSVVRGRKVGLTSKPMQQMLGVSEPDFGVVLDDMLIEDGGEVDLARFIQPKVEGEIAFLLEHDLVGPGVTSIAALRATAGVIPVLEIIDSRIADWKIGLVDTVADNASSAAVVLGGRVTSVTAIDLRLVGMVLTCDAELVDTGAGAAVLGNPATCVAWIANKLAAFGEKLHAGDVVLAGALHRAVPLSAGTVVRAEFAHLGSVTARIVDSGAA